MDRRINAVRKIELALAIIVTRVKMSNKLNLTDINIVAEDFFKTLFNLIYGYDLKNANTVKQNESAIDLYFAKEKIAYQITSQNKANKISKTVNDFISSKKYNSYTTFVIFSISIDNKCNSNSLGRLSEFNVNGLYINVSDLERQILTELDTDKLELIADYLEYETTPGATKKPAIKIKVDEKLKSLHIVDQLETVLGYFDGFNLIYPRTLSRIFPFNLEENAYDSYSNLCLRTNNEEIHKLLQKVKLNKNNEIEISDEALLPYSNKLKEIFLRLNQSLIHCICYWKDYRDIEHHNISVKRDKSDCDCHRCQYQKFNTDALFSILKEKTIKHSDDLNDALNEGYFLCKLGEHIEGWRLFNSVAIKGQEQKKPIIHFLALYNSVSIYNFVNSPWWQNEARAILPKIKDIDLHNSLCQLNVPIIVRDELINVKEEYHLNYSREKIEEHAERIRVLKDLYLRGGQSLSTPPLNKILAEIRLLFLFYTSNSIIIDDFSSFQSTITKGIEAIFCSYTTDPRYEYKYESFDNFILRMLFFYVDDDSVKRIFKTYEISTIEISKDDKLPFVKMMANFFTSQFTSNNWAGPQSNKELNKQDYFSNHRQMLRLMFSRAMRILSKVNLTIDELKPLTQPFLDFLSSNEDLNRSTWELTSLFLNKHILAFDEKQINTLIELTISEKTHRMGESFIGDICQIASNKAGFVIKDHNFFLKIFNTLSNVCSTCNRIHDMKLIIYVSIISDEKGKSLIKQKSLDYLEKSFDADFYQYSAIFDLFNKNEHTDLLNQYIEYAQDKCGKFDLIEDKGHWLIRDYTGFNCINCLAYLDVDFKTENIQLIAKKSDYYYWLINYESYDYSSFNLKWLVHICPYHLKTKFYKVAPLRDKVALALTENYDQELASFYFKYLMKKEK